MRTLLLMRHGEALNPSGSKDFDRPLSEAGKLQVQQASRRILDAGFRADHGCASPSRRTTESAVEVQAVHPGVHFTPHKNLYLTGFDQLFLVVSSFDDAVAKIWALGHNPGFSEIACRLTGEYIGLNVSQTAVCQIEAESWHEALNSTGAWTLRGFF